nr:unnamed protein product [Callosobruchus chinensis]
MDSFPYLNGNIKISIVYKCRGCQKRYDKERSLYVHQLYYCNKESKFSCPKLGCSYRSNLKSNLKRHMLLQHGMTQEEIAAFTDNIRYKDTFATNVARPTRQGTVCTTMPKFTVEKKQRYFALTVPISLTL